MKKIFLDVDQVLLCYETRFSEYLSKKIGKPGFFNKQNSAWKPRDFGGLDPDDIDDYNLEFIYSDEIYNLPPIVPAKELNSVSERYETFLVTNIPSRSIKKRELNLEALSMNYSGVIAAGFNNYGEENYPLKSEAILNANSKGDEIYFLDDLPENCEEVAKNIPDAQVFLMDHWTNQNRKDLDLIRIRDWQEFKKVLKIHD